MAPNIPSAKITLSCPLFAADFDPRDDGLLLVGGGGGEGRSGVGNKIALLNTSKRDEISEIVDIELSRDEDSVTSLAVAESNEKLMVALAGINGSQAEQQRGNNEHLRSFQIDFPARDSTNSEKAKGKKKKSQAQSQSQSQLKGTTIPLGRVSLFESYSCEIKPGQRVDTYQRLLKLSPWKIDGSSRARLGAIATGLAPSGELVLFRVTARPQLSDVVRRIHLGPGLEVEDLDIIETEDGLYKVAYTTGSDVFTFTVSLSSRTSDAPPEVKHVYRVPSQNAPARSKVRSLRFLSSDTVLFLQNEPNRTGCELALISLSHKSDGSLGRVLQRKKLRKSMKIGLGLDLCDLGSDTEKERQYIVAVSGSDQAIEIFTIEASPNRKGGYGKLTRYTTIPDVHPFSMTRICFSSFRPPSHPVASDARPPCVRLASTSMGNTVVVHTLPLFPFLGQSKTPRYVLVKPGQSETSETMFSAFVAILIIGISCFLLQVFTEIRGGVPAYLGATDWLPERVQHMVARPYMYEHGRPVIPTEIPQVLTEAVTSSLLLPTATVPLRDLLTSRLSSLAEAASAAATSIEDSIANTGATTTKTEAAPTPGILIRHDGTSLAFHTHEDESVLENHPDTSPRRWEDLDDGEREKWKKRLVDAGHWAVEEGETILEGIFFGQVGATVGDAVGG